MLYVSYFHPTDPHVGIEDCGGYTIHGTMRTALAAAADLAHSDWESWRKFGGEYGTTPELTGHTDAMVSAAVLAAATDHSRDRYATTLRYTRDGEEEIVGHYIAEAATFRADVHAGRATLTMHPAVADMIADALSIIGDDDCDRDDDRTYTCDTAHDAAEAIRAALVRIGL